MELTRTLRKSAGGCVRWKYRRFAKRFERQLGDCRRTQLEVLRRLIALNAGSRFHVDHRLDALTTLEQFRQRLPVAGFDYFRDYIEDVKRGNHQALLGRNNHLLMFALSSGTTSDSKFVPITKQFLKDYRRGWSIWGIRAMDAHPDLHLRNIVQLTSDYSRSTTVGGTPCGNISGLVAAMQNRVVRRMYSIPGAISKIDDPDARYYTALRLAIADEQVGMVTTANPSTLIHLARFADAHRQHLIRDIFDGTLSHAYPVCREIRKELGSRIRLQRRSRARFLEQVVERTATLLPRDYWPHLGLVAVWTGGSCGQYLNGLRECFGSVPVRDHGLSASEGRMTIPFSDEDSSGILDISSHFFEFIPEDEYGSADPSAILAHELEVGQRYFIVLTTASGLYRYDISDVVECVGFHRTTPLLKFLHKGAHISNLTGEKVSESQIIDAVRDCLQRMHLSVEQFTVAPAWGDPPRYRLLIESRNSDQVLVGTETELALRVDRRLQDLNCEYREKRRTGRLARLEEFPVPPGTWRRFAENRQASLGGSIEQYKHPCLVPDIELCPRLVNEFQRGSVPVGIAGV